MKLLLDECLPKKLKEEFQEHNVMTVPEAGFAGKKNGELLRLIAGKFDCFITIDQNLTYQQNLAHAEIGIIVLQAIDSRQPTLKPLMSKVKESLKTLKPGKIIKIAQS